MATTLSIDPTMPRQRFRQTLDSVDYIIQITYNTRTDSYWFSLYKADETPLVTGVHIRPGVSLLRPYRSTDLPAGDLVVVSDTGLTPAYGELGDSARIVYVPAS